MAANLVDSLFGPTPYDIGQSRNQQDMSYAEKVARMNGFEQAKFGIGQGAAGLTRAGAGMLGMVDPLQEEAKMREGVMGMGGDLTTSQGLKAKAMQFAQAGDQRTAMKLVIAAREMEAKEQQMLLERQKQALAERKQTDIETEKRELDREKLKQAFEIAKMRSEDSRLAAADRAAAAREANQIRLEIAKMMLESKKDKDAAKQDVLKEAKATGAEDVNVAIASLRDSYDRLEKGGGITTTKKAGLGNIPASIASSGIGQMAGKMLGTANQSARNEIAMTRPALLAALMKATGMSAKQMDSNAELKLWITTATDPQLDVESNRKALDNIEKKYLGASKPADSFDADKERRYQEWKARQGK